VADKGEQWVEIGNVCTLHMGARGRKGKENRVRALLRPAVGQPSGVAKVNDILRRLREDTPKRLHPIGHNLLAFPLQIA
jgi:hypothetical protein